MSLTEEQRATLQAALGRSMDAESYAARAGGYEAAMELQERNLKRAKPAKEKAAKKKTKKKASKK